MSPSIFPSLLQRFFTDRLLGQLGASPHTVAAYRDTFRLFLRFATTTLRRAPSALRIEEFDVTFLSTFLEHLESTRENTTRTRNNRLSALHAFFRYVAISEPALGLQCQRILAMPAKRDDRGPVEFLTEDECAALVAAPNLSAWIGRRDRALLLVAIQTGLRTVRSRDSDTKTSRSGPARTCDAWAKAASGAARHYGQTSWPYSTSGYQNNVGNRVIRSSRAYAEDVSAPTHSSGSSRDMSPPHSAPAPRWPPST